MKSKMHIGENGTKFWTNPNGELHREDGPAAEYSNGNKSWYLNGEYHREDGPATEHPDGTKEWLINGYYHREDGPAVEGSISNHWYLNGIHFTEQEHKLEMRIRKLKQLL